MQTKEQMTPQEWKQYQRDMRIIEESLRFAEKFVLIKEEKKKRHTSKMRSQGDGVGV
ncbi:MAG: hypothetical protein ACOCXQ_04470 [Patescibacteria group bacterium]